AGKSGSKCGEWDADQSELDGVDGQRWGDAVPGRALPGNRVQQFCPDRDRNWYYVQQHWADGEQQLQLSGAGDGWGGESERLFQCGQCDDGAGGRGDQLRAGELCDAADGAAGGGSDVYGGAEQW